MYNIPHVVIVGYGRTQVIQHKCLECGDLFFPNNQTQAFCELHDSLLYKNKFKQEKIFRIEIIDFIQKTVASHKRKTKNLKKVMIRDNYTCRYCEYSPNYVLDFIPLHIDHILPFSYGGSNHIDNLVVACQWCNLHLSNIVFKSFFDKKAFIVDLRKKHALPFTEKMWREKSGILMGNLA